MSSADRQPHKTATVITQQFLDFSMDNLENDLRMTVDIDVPEGFKEGIEVIFDTATSTIDTPRHHGLVNGETVKFSTTGSLPPEITAGTIYYVRDALSLEFQVSATPGALAITFSPDSGTHTATLTTPKIRASDRNLYRGVKFYEATTKFPIIRRTVGEWLSPQVEFSSLTLSIQNVLGRLNSIIPGGSLYEGFINRNVEVKLGLRDVESTYQTIFKGLVSEVGGFKRDVSKITITSRDDFNKLSVDFPTNVMKLSEFPKLENSLVGKSKPVIYGDFTEEVNTEGNVTGIVVNGRDPQIDLQTIPVQISVGSPAVFTSEDHRLTSNTKIQLTTGGSLPSPLFTGVDYYVIPISANTFQVSGTSGPGSPVNTTGGGTGVHEYTAQDRVNVKILISENDLSFFDFTNVWVEKNEAIYRFSSSDIINIDPNNKAFEITQDTGNTLIDGANYVYEAGDIFTVRVIGPVLGGGTYTSNPVEIAKQILLDFTDSVASDFDTNWDVIRDKATPAESAVSLIKARVWRQERASALEYVLSLLEQVRLEAFISKDLKIKLNELHFDAWEPLPTHIVRNFDVEENSVKVSIDERNNFNTAQGFYDFSPRANENINTTLIFRNQAAIDQLSGKRIAKAIEFPNLYVKTDVENQVKEIIKLASSYSEFVEMSLTSRALLLDIGDFVKMSVNIGSTVWTDVPMMIRDFGVDPVGLKINVKLWSFEMTPFANPSGWNPGTSGIVGGDLATITEE